MKILDGIRVLDLGRFIAVPYCGWLLACLGAEVIRVESPRKDMDRITGLVTETGDSPVFLTWVTGKKSVTLNFAKGDKARSLFT